MPLSSRSGTVVSATLTTTAVLVPLAFAPSWGEPFLTPKLVVAWCSVLLAGSLVLIDVWRHGPGSAKTPRGVNVGLALLAGSLLVSTVLSVDPDRSLAGLRLQRTGLLMFVLILASGAVAAVGASRWSNVRQSVTNGLLAGSALVAAYAIAQRFGIDPVWGHPTTGRSVASVGQPNALAGYLVVCLPGFAADSRNGLQRYWRLAGAVLVAAAIVATESRGGVLAAIVAGATLASCAAPRSRQFVGRQRAALLLCVPVLTVCLAGTAAALSVTSLDLNMSGSIADRIDVWSVAVHVVADRPVFGWGLETFPERFSEVAPHVLPAERMSYFGQFSVESPHHLFLNVAASAGLIAVGALVWLLVVLARRFELSIRQHRAAFASLAGFVVVNCFMSQELTSMWAIVVFVGVTLGETRHSVGAAASEADTSRPDVRAMRP